MSAHEELGGGIGKPRRSFECTVCVDGLVSALRRSQMGEDVPLPSRVPTIFKCSCAKGLREERNFPLWRDAGPDYVRCES